jgi:hypothetical protein
MLLTSSARIIRPFYTFLKMYCKIAQLTSTAEKRYTYPELFKLVPRRTAGRDSFRRLATWPAFRTRWPQPNRSFEMKEITASGGSVLLVSPHEEDFLSLGEILQNSATVLRLATNLGEARRAIDAAPPAAVIGDSRDWKDLLQLIQGMPSPPPLIVADRFANERLWGEVLNLGGYDLLTKPFAREEVLHVLKLACHRSQAIRQSGERYLTATQTHP